jgi:hypothetical protein
MGFEFLYPTAHFSSHHESTSNRLASQLVELCNFPTSFKPVKVHVGGLTDIISLVARDSSPPTPSFSLAFPPFSWNNTSHKKDNSQI